MIVNMIENKRLFGYFFRKVGKGHHDNAEAYFISSYQFRY